MNVLKALFLIVIISGALAAHPKSRLSQPYVGGPNEWIESRFSTFQTEKGEALTTGMPETSLFRVLGEPDTIGVAQASGGALLILNAYLKEELVVVVQDDKILYFVRDKKWVLMLLDGFPAAKP